MGVHPNVRENQAFDVGLSDGAVDVGQDDPRRLVQEVDRERYLHMDRVDDEKSFVESGLKSNSCLLHIDTSQQCLALLWISWPYEASSFLYLDEI